MGMRGKLRKLDSHSSPGPKPPISVVPEPCCYQLYAVHPALQKRKAFPLRFSKDRAQGVYLTTPNQPHVRQQNVQRGKYSAVWGEGARRYYSSNIRLQTTQTNHAAYNATILKYNVHQYSSTPVHQYSLSSHTSLGMPCLYSGLSIQTSGFQPQRAVHTPLLGPCPISTWTGSCALSFPLGYR